MRKIARDDFVQMFSEKMLISCYILLSSHPKSNSGSALNASPMNEPMLASIASTHRGAPTGSLGFKSSYDSAILPINFYQLADKWCAKLCQTTSPMSECHLLSSIPVIDPRWICDRPCLQSETLAEAQSHQLIASFALRQISCAMCSRTGFMSHSQSRKKNSWATFKRNILQILWDVQQLGSFYTRIYIYMYVYVCICMYFSLLHVTVWKPGNWFESVAHPCDGEAGFLHSRPSQVPLFFPIIKGSRRGMAWPTTLANQSSCPQVIGGFIVSWSTYKAWCINNI